MAEKRQSGQTLFEDWYELVVEPEAACFAAGLAGAFFRVVRGLAAAVFALGAAFFLDAGAAGAGLGATAALVSGAAPSVLVLRIEAIS